MKLSIDMCAGLNSFKPCNEMNTYMDIHKLIT